jgi:hypothetical protein
MGTKAFFSRVAHRALSAPLICCRTMAFFKAALRRSAQTAIAHEHDPRNGAECAIQGGIWLVPGCDGSKGISRVEVSGAGHRVAVAVDTATVLQRMVSLLESPRKLEQSNCLISLAPRVGIEMAQKLLTLREFFRSDAGFYPDSYPLQHCAAVGLPAMG